MTQLDDLQAYLSGVAAVDEYDTAVLTSVLAVETAAQAAVLKAGVVPSAHPDLVEALYRRVARNLAMRTLPLGISDSEDGQVRLGGRDPEVRRLESPYRKRVVG